MTIAIDIDGVVNNLAEAVISVYNDDYNDNLTIDNITEYHIENFVKPEAKENFYKYFTDKRTWKRIKAVNVEAVQHLIDNYDVYFVTSTEPCNLAKKQNWLSRNFTNINLRKRLVRLYDKGKFKADVLIDDCIKNLESDPDKMNVCIAQPYNTSFTGLRFNTVQDFVDFLEHKVNIDG